VTEESTAANTHRINSKHPGRKIADPGIISRLPAEPNGHSIPISLKSHGNPIRWATLTLNPRGVLLEMGGHPMVFPPRRLSDGTEELVLQREIYCRVGKSAALPTRTCGAAVWVGKIKPLPTLHRNSRQSRSLVVGLGLPHGRMLSASIAGEKGAGNSDSQTFSGRLHSSESRKISLRFSR
jgi:hypothetical protein